MATVVATVVVAMVAAMVGEAMAAVMEAEGTVPGRSSRSASPFPGRSTSR